MCQSNICLDATHRCVLANGGGVGTWLIDRISARMSLLFFDWSSRARVSLPPTIYNSLSQTSGKWVTHKSTMPISSIIKALRAHARSQRDTSFQANTQKLQWRLVELFMRTWDLGFTAFGGPPVHFQILHRRFVEGVGFSGGSKWIDEQTVIIP